MKPLDQFKRTPLRRYDKAPPPPPEEKRTLEPAIRKRYFGVPSFERMHAGRWLGGAICAAMLLTLCNASAPMGDVPSVQERFSQWAVIQNEKTVQQLPGATPEPDSALAAAASKVLKKYKGAYCVESFDPRCLMWLWQNEPDILRGQLSENFTAHGDAQHLPGGIRWILANLLLNVRTRPDFIAYRFEDRGNLSLRLCRGFYKVQEASWTVRDRETMEKAEAAGNLVIFEHFDPRG